MVRLHKHFFTDNTLKIRVEWETMVVKGSDILIELEEERWTNLKRALKKYVTLASTLGPVRIFNRPLKYFWIIDERVRLKFQGSPSEEATSIEEHFEAVLTSEKQTALGFLVQSPSAMHLPDFYCQHTTLAMNKERRKQVMCLWLIRLGLCTLEGFFTLKDPMFYFSCRCTS